MTACLTVHMYEDMYYAVLTSLDGQCTRLAESTVYRWHQYAALAMHRYAREHGIRLIWTDLKPQPDGRVRP